MPDRAGIGADTYRIPVQQPYNAAMSGGGAAAKPYDDGLAFEKSLQEAEGQTQAYYEKVAALKSFMLDMHKNRGIDVRVPDLAHPDSIALNQIYQRGLADIMHQANKLKMNQAEREYRINRGDIMTEAGRANERAGQPLQQGYDYYGNQPTAGVSATNAETAQPAYTQGSFAEQQHRAATERAVYEKMKKDNPKMAEYADAQIQAINTPTQEVFAPWHDREGAADRAAKRQIKSHGNIIKEFTHLKNGVGYTETSKTWVNPTNTDHLLQIKPNFMDMKWNGKQVKEWGHDPLTDQTFMKFDDGSTEDVTNQDPMSLARIVTPQANWQYLEAAADENDWNGKFGQLDQSKILDKGTLEAKENSKELVRKDLATRQYAGLKDQVKSISEGTSYLLGTRSGGKFKLTDRADADVKKKKIGNGLLYISNFDEVFPNPGSKDAKKAEAWKRARLKFSADGTGTDWSEMATFLNRYGASQYLNSATTESGKTATQAIKESAKDKAARLIKEAQQ